MARHHNPETVRSPLQPVLKTPGNNQARCISCQTATRIYGKQTGIVHNPKRNPGLLQIPENVWHGPIHHPQAHFFATLVANFGKKEGYLSSAIESCSVSKERVRRTPPPSVSELNALLRVAAPHIQRVILLGIYTGARIGPSELFSLKWDDVDLTRGVIGIRLVGQILNARHGRESQLKTKPLPGSI